MTESAGAPDAARLDELAAVTREYGKYSRQAFGFASALTGAYMLSALALRALSAPWGNVVFAFVPILWLVLLPRARRYYQRHGGVLVPEPNTEGLAADLVFPIFTWVFAILGLAALARYQLPWARATGIPGYLGLLAAAVAFLVAPWMARRRATGITASALTSGLVGFALGAFHGSSFLRWPCGVLAMAFIVVGTQQHLAFRRLERRLAALKERAP